MNILFMTIGRMANIEEHTIYCDLLRCFRDHGHNVYTISPYEKRLGKPTEYTHTDGVHMLHVATGNVTGRVGLIEKGMAQLTLEKRFIAGIKKYFKDVRFDLVMYSTPPITFCKAVQYVKKRDGARTYLLLKDIFPQNAVDLGMMTKSGPKGLLYKMFRRKERRLYAVSDTIGCMSEANRRYVLQHNPEVRAENVEVCPNSVDVIDQSCTAARRQELREKYGISQDKRVFLYGGNLGKPQGIPFLIECLKSQKTRKDVCFLVVGDGTEYPKLERFLQEEKPENVKLMKRLPKDDYDAMVAACDVGMIFLDHRFTIPNFPSRLLAYMQAKLPVLACTDPNTDVGAVAEEGGFGWWCESNDVAAFSKAVELACKTDLKQMGEAGFRYLNEHYTVEIGYQIIMKHCK